MNSAHALKVLLALRARHAGRALALVGASALLTGCMSTTPVWDTRFGESVRAVMAAQIIDPDAASHTASPDSIGGPAATAALDQYDKSFRTPDPVANAFVIGVGNGRAGGQ